MPRLEFRVKDSYHQGDYLAEIEWFVDEEDGPGIIKKEAEMLVAFYPHIDGEYEKQPTMVYRYVHTEYANGIHPLRSQPARLVHVFENRFKDSRFLSQEHYSYNRLIELCVIDNKGHPHLAISTALHEAKKKKMSTRQYDQLIALLLKIHTSAQEQGLLPVRRKDGEKIPED